MIVGVRKALEQRLSSLSPTWPTAWENVGFTADASVPFQRVFMLPGSPLSDGLFAGSVIRHIGVFQVDVCTALEGGPNSGDARAAAIQAHFRRGTALAISGVQNLWVPDHPTISPAIFDATWRVVSVTIPWNVFEGA
jgi:hypothetical protein